MRHRLSLSSLLRDRVCDLKTDTRRCVIGSTSSGLDCMPTACYGHRCHFAHRSGQLCFSRRRAPNLRSHTSRCHRTGVHASGSTAAAPLDVKDVPVVMPEEYWLPPGELSTIDRRSDVQMQDMFKCFGCTRPECEVRNCSCSASGALPKGRLLPG